jgi:uncharacterized ferritin-like protein (DUF455 family)
MAAVASFSSILEGALAVLREPDPYAKAAIAESLAARCADLPLRPVDVSSLSLAPPAKPARPSWVETVDAARAPKRGRGGTLASRVAMLHALVHIESYAVDLAADCVARFAAAAAGNSYPRELATDFVAVLADEARHFSLLDARLGAVHAEGKGYGCLPVHEGLWESAERTAASLPARLAVESCLHEARGLDVLPLTVSRFRAGGDSPTADLLESVVFGEEIAHCAAGVRWLTFLHARACGAGERRALRRASAAAGPPVAFPLGQTGLQEEKKEEEEESTGELDEEEEEDGVPPFAAPGGHGEEDWRDDARRHATPALWFRSLVERNFHGRLMPPFNESARARAGFTREWYAEEVGGAEEQTRAAAAAAAAEETGGEGGGGGDARPRDQKRVDRALA